MNDNLDDFLNSLGIEAQHSNTAVIEGTTSPAMHDPIRSAITNGDLPEESQPQTLPNDDFDDILSDFGFSRTQEAEAEEIHDGSDDEGVEDEEEVGNTEEYDENDREGRDLDAEEDADWQEAIDSGGVVPFDPVEHAGTQEVHLHMPNGEVIDVPVVTEDQNQELHELEQAAIEAHQAVVEAPQQQEALIPLNSPTLLMDDSTARFSGAEWYNEIQKQRIIVAGQGGIGSNLTFQLARMHPAALFLYDDDYVEAVNMAGQLYARSDVGKTKVSAISDMIAAYTNMQNIFAIDKKFTAETEAGDIMICGFDNMEARKIFFSKWLDHVEEKPLEEQKKCLFLDGRLSMDTLQILCIVGDDRFNINRYRSEFLFSDDEAEHTVCSMKQTTYLACMIGSIMTNLFTNFVANTIDPVIPYDLPFFTEYDAQNMIFKTEK